MIGSLCAAAATLAALALAPLALGNAYKPNKLGDHAPNGCTHHDCTLREAVIKANSHPGADAIVLRSRKTYTLTRVGYEDEAALGDLDVRGSLTIAPTGKRRATIDALDGGTDPGQADRILELIGERRLTLRSLVLKDGGPVDGEDGGAIRATDGSLRVIHCLLKHNSAGPGGTNGISLVFADAVISHSRLTGNGFPSFHGDFGAIEIVGGDLRLVRSVLSRNEAGSSGGGIYAAPANSVHIVRSRIVDNTALSGSAGGILAGGPVVVSKSTIADNHAPGGDGGGIYAYGNLRVQNSTISGNDANHGGGIAQQDPGTSTKATNSTITKNSADAHGGGINGSAGELTLRSVTVARNSLSGTSFVNYGGGLAGGGSFTVRNSIVALNHVSGAAVNPDCSGPFNSEGVNLFSDLSGCTGFNQPPNLVRSDPKLGQLADNGGPTKTIALLRHSAAINNAGAGSPSRDQRGVKRHNPDIGAYERR